jgi:hypothetical protein
VTYYLFRLSSNGTKSRVLSESISVLTSHYGANVVLFSAISKNVLITSAALAKNGSKEDEVKGSEENQTSTIVLVVLE